MSQLGLLCSYVLDNHDQEWQFDSECLVSVGRACNVVGGDVGAHNFKDGALNVGVRNSLNVTVPNALVPNLKRLRPIEKRRISFVD